VFGPGSEFGFEKLLPILRLPVTCSKADPYQVRHTLGFGFPVPLGRKNLCMANSYLINNIRSLAIAAFASRYYPQEASNTSFSCFSTCSPPWQSCYDAVAVVQSSLKTYS
jgi:hypothetical protein